MTASSSAPPDARTAYRVHVSLPPNLIDLVDQEARNQFTNRSEVVRRLVVAQLAAIRPAG